MAHLFGSDRGDPGLERALFGVQSGALPEALEVVKGKTRRVQGQQRRASDDRSRPATGRRRSVERKTRRGRRSESAELAKCSRCTANLPTVSRKLKTKPPGSSSKRTSAIKPLVSRALGAYYIPGSTFKTVTMTAAFSPAMQDTEFTCSGGGYYAAPGANVIFDDGGRGRSSRPDRDRHRV